MFSNGFLQRKFLGFFLILEEDQHVVKTYKSYPLTRDSSLGLSTNNAYPLRIYATQYKAVVDVLHDIN